MIKRLFLSFISVAFLASLLTPAATVYANSASVFVSPGSKSVTKGDVFTIQVRVNSGADEMNSAQTRLNFDSSKLQLQGHSAGVFNPVNTSNGSSSFFLAGASLGTTYSGNQLLYQVTFKATSSGSAALSISEAQVANAGSALSVSTGGGSVSIANPPTNDDKDDDSSGGSSGGSTADKPSSDSSGGGSSFQALTPEPEPEPEPPQFVSGPDFAPAQGSITVTLESDQESRVQILYSRSGEDETKTLRVDDAQTSHEIIIGKDTPLLAGQAYEIEVVLIGQNDVRSEPKTKTVRTQGVRYRVKIVDTQGDPLKDHPVELHSDPLQTITDSDGYATFEDVTPGEHTLVFEIGGITVRQPVQVGQSVTLMDDAAEDQADETIQLPFQLSSATTRTITQTRWDLVIIAGVVGAVVMFVLQNKRVRQLVVRAGKSFRHASKLHLHHH
jgi:hypothetical protein